MTSPAHADDARVVVYSRVDCHLCEVAEQLVAEICADTGDSWVRVEIDGEPDLVERFTEQVPVTFVDGKQHDFWRVDERRLRGALGKPQPAG